MAGIQTPGKLGESQEKPESILMMNEKTDQYRKILTATYIELLSHMPEINIEEGDLVIKRIEQYAVIPQFIFDILPKSTRDKWLEEATGLELAEKEITTEQKIQENGS